MTQVKMVALGQFLSAIDIKKAATTPRRDVDTICETIIKPQLAEIDRDLEQENDPKYLACMVVHAFDQAARKVNRLTVAFLTEVRLTEVPIPSFEAQKHVTDAVDRVDKIIALSEQKTKLLHELRRTLLHNWTDRDPQTGKQIRRDS